MSSNSSLNIVKGKDFTPSNISYKPVQTNSRGGKNCLISYNGQPLRIRIPLMLTWGVNERVDEQSGRVSYDFSLQFEGNTSSSQDKFLERMKEFQEKLKADAVANSKAWFGKSKMSPDVIDALMHPILKYPQMKDGSGEPDYDRFPTMKVKLPYWDGRFTVELYDMNKKPMYLPPKKDSTEVPSRSPVDLLPKGAHLNGIIQCNGMWFAGGKFGVTWKLLQACTVLPTRLVGGGTCHVEDDSDDEEAMETLNRRREAEEAAMADDDDEEEEDADEEEDEEESVQQEVEEEVEEEVVKPKKKKKVVRRRKKTAAAE